MDVAVGNPSEGYWQYGLEFASGTWKSMPIGDGAPIKAYAFPYSEEQGEVLTYYAQVGDGRKSLKALKPIGKSLSRKITISQ